MEWGFANEFKNLEWNGDLPMSLRTQNGNGFANKFLQLEMEKEICL